VKVLGKKIGGGIKIIFLPFLGGGLNSFLYIIPMFQGGLSEFWGGGHSPPRTATGDYLSDTWKG